jgi:hypothetical protein
MIFIKRHLRAYYMILKLKLSAERLDALKFRLRADGMRS